MNTLCDKCGVRFEKTIKKYYEGYEWGGETNDCHETIHLYCHDCWKDNWSCEICGHEFASWRHYNLIPNGCLLCDTCYDKWDDKCSTDTLRTIDILLWIISQGLF